MTSKPKAREFVERTLREFSSNEMTATDLWNWYVQHHGVPPFSRFNINNALNSLLKAGVVERYDDPNDAKTYWRLRA